MPPDHYTTLGVAPNSGLKVIRAAYLMLMRRYHPDRNSSAAAAAQVRAITGAYAVLSMSDRRSTYDLERARLRAAQASAFTAERPRPPLAAWLAALSCIVAFVLLAPLLIPAPMIPAERSDSTAGLAGRQVAAPSQLVQAAVPQEQVPALAGAKLGGLCSSPATAGRIKDELFRRAAQRRGSGQEAFDRLATHSFLRFTSTVLGDANPESGAVICAASIALDLPPGVAARGGLRGLTGKIGYSLQGDGDVTGPLRLTTEGQIVELLATLEQASNEPVAAVIPTVARQTRDERPPLVERKPLIERTQPTVSAAASHETRAEPQRPAFRQNPSFSCEFTNSWATVVVCNNAHLAALDREMASLYGNSMGRADVPKRAILLQSHGQFLARRDGCSSHSCVQGAYVARLGEIQEIMAGR